MQRQDFIKAIFIIATLAFSASSQAETITAKRTLPACTSEAYSHEMHGYEATKNQKGVTALISSGKCVAITTGEVITILRPGILTATIEYQGRKLFARSDALR